MADRSNSWVNQPRIVQGVDPIGQGLVQDPRRNKLAAEVMRQFGGQPDAAPNEAPPEDPTAPPTPGLLGRAWLGLKAKVLNPELGAADIQLDRQRR